MSKVDERLLKQILSYPWSGKQYSKALWDNTDQLAALTRRELTLGFMSGASVDKIAKEIDDVMGREGMRPSVWYGQRPATLPIRASCLRIRMPG